MFYVQYRKFAMTCYLCFNIKIAIPDDFVNNVNSSLFMKGFQWATQHTWNHGNNRFPKRELKELSTWRTWGMNPMPNKKSATRLSANILNYFAAFTETRFNFRTLINYRWTDNELTLDLGIFQDFQDELLQRIKTGDSTPITVKNRSKSSLLNYREDRLTV